MSKTGQYWAPRGPRKLIVWWFWGVEILTMGRRYWDSGGDDGEGVAYAVAVTLVMK